MSRLRVMTLNVGSLLEPDWDRRRHEVVAWLQRVDPDVVCLQETWQDLRAANTGGWVIDQLGEPWSWCFGGHSFATSMWTDATLQFGSVIGSRWPIDGSTCHRLPVAAGATGMVADVPWELLQVKTAGLDVFSTHLAPAPSDGLHRRQQVMAIDQIIRDSRGALDDIAGFGQRRGAMPAVLCGDFNAEPDSDEIRYLCGLTALEGRTTFLQDSWRVAGEGSGLTQDWHHAPLAASLNVHRKRIDYIFVGDPFMRAGDGGRVWNASVVADHPLTGIMASDHFGVVAEICWPARP